MSIHINYNGSEWCSKCHQSFEDVEKLKEHLASCTGKQIQFGDHSDDIDVRMKNEMDNEDKGSLIDDENSLMEEVEEVEFESEAEGDATENHDDSNSDHSESEASDDIISDEEENEDEIEVEEDEVDEDNEIDDESRTQSRVTGDVSSDPQSEDEDSEHPDEDLSGHSESEHNDKETNNISFLSGTEDTNVMENEEHEDEQLQEQEKVVDKVESLEKKMVDANIDQNSHGLADHSRPQTPNEKEFDEKPCELQNQALFKEEPGDYSDDEGPPILSPMVPLPTVNETNQSDKVEHELSPMTTVPPSTSRPTVTSELEEIKNEIEKGESAIPASHSMELDENTKASGDPDVAANTLTDMLESDSKNDQEEEKEHQDEEEKEHQDDDDDDGGGGGGVSEEEKASENEEVSENEDAMVEEEEKEEEGEEEEGEEEENQSENDDHHEDALENCDEQEEDNFDDMQNAVEIAEDMFEENSDGEIEDMEIEDDTDTVQIPSLDGTVLMVANDADGNQILIQRNVSDLPNEDSNPEVTEYILEGENEYEIDNYEMGSNDEDAAQQSDNSHEISEEEENNVEGVEDSQISIISAKSKVSRT